MKLVLLKNKNIIQTIDVSNKDPLSLYSYQEILLKDKNPILCLLVCQTTQFVYMAKDIIEMRYSIEDQINVFLLKDPLSREIVEDLWFFEVTKNVFYEMNSKDEASVLVNQSVDKTNLRNLNSEPSICAEFIANEMGIIYNKSLQYKVLKYKREDGDVFSLVLYIIFVIFAIFLLLFSFSLTIQTKIKL